MSQYSPKPCQRYSKTVKVGLDLWNYAAKPNLK